MEILTETQHRALAFIAAANAGGYGPSTEELTRWLSNPTPRHSGGYMEQFRSAVHNLTAFKSLGDVMGTRESTAEHLGHLRWVTDDLTSLRLTPLGQALLRSAEMDEASQPTVLVLDSEDPLAYIQLLGVLSDVTGALLVDPYIDANELLDLMEYTSVERILTGDKDQAKRTRVTALLAKTPAPSVEARYCSGLHDRMIVADDGRVWTIGASLNTVSKRKSSTVLTPMPPEAAATLKSLAEKQWTTASPLAPPALEPGPSTEASTGEDGTKAPSHPEQQTP